jgi:hypothetical protein
MKSPANTKLLPIESTLISGEVHCFAAKGENQKALRLILEGFLMASFQNQLLR